MPAEGYPPDMLAAFLTGALATAIVAAGFSALVLWIVAVLFSGGVLHPFAPLMAVTVGLVVGVVVLLAERIAHRRTRQAWTLGEPWAYRGGSSADRARRYGDPRG
jgi:ABC-type protease/lipase transport system fused ATPase/permease subunit